MIRTRSNQSNRGFTVTEILVSVAITGTVVALMLPAVNRSREETRTLQGLNNLQQIGQTIHVYAVDNYNTLPIGYAGGESAGAYDWQVLLNDYLSGAGATYTALANQSNNQTLPIFRDPNATFPNQGLYHYMGHPLLMPDQDVVEDHKDSTDSLYDIYKDLIPYKLSRFRRPHEVVLVMDGIQLAGHKVPYTCGKSLAEAAAGGIIRPPTTTGNANLFKGYYNEYAAIDNDTPPPGPDRDTGTFTGNDFANIRWRQRGGTAANFVFPDGHAETLAKPDILSFNGQVIQGTGGVKIRNFRIDR